MAPENPTTGMTKPKITFWSLPPSRLLWRWLWVFLAGLWLTLPLLLHTNGLYVFYEDNAVMLDRALDLVDTGRPILFGNLFFRDFQLGPFANYLAALPLLISRDLRGQYLWVNLLMLLAVPMFYAGMRKLGGDRRFALLGTVAFAFSLPFTHGLNPVNTHYLPFFLALYLFLLAQVIDNRRYAIVAVWPLVGLLMQLQMVATILLPATYIALPRQRRLVVTPAMLLGLAFLGLTQISLVWQLFDHDRVGRAATHFSDGSLGNVVDLYRTFLPRWLVMGPSGFGPGNALFGAAALLIMPWLFRCFPWCRTFFAAGLWSIGGGILIYPLLSTVKGYLAVHYFSCVIVFWAPFVAYFFRAFEQWAAASSLRRFSYAATLALFLFLTVVGHYRLIETKAPDDTYIGMMMFKDQMRIADRLAGHVEQLDLDHVDLQELVYDWSDFRPKLRSDSTATYHALTLYRHPELRPRLGWPHCRTLFVQVVPRDHADDVGQLPVPRGTRIGRFATDQLFVQLFLTPRAPVCDENHRPAFEPVVM